MNNDDFNLAKVLERGVSKSETSRRNYADIDENVPMDKLFIDDINKDNKTHSISETNQEKVNSLNFKSDEEKWLYACKDNCADGTIYSIDKSGNLIAKIDVNTLWEKVNILNGNIQLTEDDKTHLLNIINEVKKQINFINEQESLKEEIKGYPEFNETITKIYNMDDVIPRFKNEKNMLRAMLSSKELSDLRLLLSIAETKNVDYFNQLISDKILGSEYFPISYQHTKKIFDGMIRWSNIYRKFPSIKTLVMLIGLPYSAEFFSEYLYEETFVDVLIEQRYTRLRTVYCKCISDYLRENTCVSEELMQALTNLDYITIPPSCDTSFEKLRETIENQKEDVILSTGVKILDERKAFIKKGRITSIFAYTGSYKTMFCSNIAYNNMIESKNVLYLSLEISKEEMYINFLSRHSFEFDKKISHSDIKNNTLDYEEKDFLFNNVYTDFNDKLKSHLIVFDETDITSNTYAMFSKLLLQADNNFNKKTGHGIDMIIVDHINLLKYDSEEKSYNDYSAINHWMSYFRKNAINFLNQKRQVAIICACQSSREGYKNAMKNGRYDLTGIAEGNEIERSSELVLSIFTSDSDRQENKTTLQILKLRNGEQSIEPLHVGLKPEYYKFGLEIEQPISTDDEELYDDPSELLIG